MFTVLITGSRTWEDWDWIYDDLYRIANLVNEKNMIIRHGACPAGADDFAKDWATENRVEQDQHPADWGQYGKSAGFVRNSEMVNKDPKPNICFAYIDACSKSNCKSPGRHGSHGGMMCGELAEKAGIHTVWRKTF